MIWLADIARFAFSKVGRWVVGALALIALVIGLRANARREGRHDAIEEMKNADRAEADALRRRVDVARRRPVHDDDRGYRD